MIGGKLFSVMRDLTEKFSMMHGVSLKISYFLTSFYYEVLYISSILAGGHTGVVTFLV